MVITQLYLETINELGVLANLLINTQLNASDKVGMAPAFGITRFSIQYAIVKCRSCNK